MTYQGIVSFSHKLLLEQIDAYLAHKLVGNMLVTNEMESVVHHMHYSNSAFHILLVGVGNLDTCRVDKEMYTVEYADYNKWMFLDELELVLYSKKGY